MKELAKELDHRLYIATLVIPIPSYNEPKKYQKNQVVVFLEKEELFSWAPLGDNQKFLLLRNALSTLEKQLIDAWTDGPFFAVNHSFEEKKYKSVPASLVDPPNSRE